MIEDDLRTLLAAHSDEVQDNPARVSDVHARISGIRRRRTVVTTLALVLVVAAGVLFTRLPGKPETLPAGVPSGPYFNDDGIQQSVRGFHGEHYATFTEPSVWSSSQPGLRTVVVARCDRPGDLTLRNQPDQRDPVEQRLRCRVPVGDHFEGALPLDPKLNDAGLFGVAPDQASSGTWTVGLLTPLYLDRIEPTELTTKLINGLGHPGGGSFRFAIPGTLPQAHAFGIEVLCVRDVRLEFRISGRLLTTVACTDDAKVVTTSLVTVLVPERTVTGLGLRPTQVVTMDVRSTGRQTDQWSVIGLG